MKVVILGSAHPLRGGLASYNERLALEYQRSGHEVIIYTFSLQYPSFLFPGTTQYSDQPPPKELDIRVKVNSVNPVNWWVVGREIAALKPDLLLIKFWLPFMAPCLGSIARLVKRNGHTKVVSIVDNIIPHESRIGDRALADFFVNSVDGFIAMSENVMEDLKKFNDHKPRLFSPHPLFDNFGTAVSKRDACHYLKLDPAFDYILFFGFIRDYKGLDLLLEAMPALRALANVKLIVAGEFYSDSKTYLDLIDRLQIEDRLVLKTDFIPDDQVRYYFGAADIVVQPYKHATQSGVTQICYHFEKPMLVTNVGGLPEIVPHGKVGYVVRPDAPAIAAAVEDFYRNSRKGQMEQAVREGKQKYAWSRMPERIDELYAAIS